jgi:hypothetical protein
MQNDVDSSHAAAVDYASNKTNEPTTPVSHLLNLDATLQASPAQDLLGARRNATVSPDRPDASEKPIGEFTPTPLAPLAEAIAASPASEEILVLHLYGVSDAGSEIRAQLPRILTSKLDSMVLESMAESVSHQFSATSLLQLSPADLHFLRPADVTPQLAFTRTVPPFVQQPDEYARLVHKSLRALQPAILACVPGSASVDGSCADDASSLRVGKVRTMCFIYNHLAGNRIVAEIGKGMAFVTVALEQHAVALQSSPESFLPCRTLMLEQWVDVAAEHGSGLELSVKAWVRGGVEVKALQRWLELAFSQALSEVVIDICLSQLITDRMQRSVYIRYMSEIVDQSQRLHAPPQAIHSYVLPALVPLWAFGHVLENVNGAISVLFPKLPLHLLVGYDVDLIEPSDGRIAAEIDAKVQADAWRGTEPSLYLLAAAPLPPSTPEVSAEALAPNVAAFGAEAMRTPSGDDALAAAVGLGSTSTTEDVWRTCVLSVQFERTRVCIRALNCDKSRIQQFKVGATASARF